MIRCRRDYGSSKDLQKDERRVIERGVIATKLVVALDACERGGFSCDSDSFCVATSSCRCRGLVNLLVW